MNVENSFISLQQRWEETIPFLDGDTRFHKTGGIYVTELEREGFVHHLTSMIAIYC